MQAPRVVLLDDEDAAAPRLPRAVPASVGLGRRREIALGAILLERHPLSPPLFGARAAAAPLWPASGGGALPPSSRALAQRRQEVRRRLSARRASAARPAALELGLDEFGERRLVAVVESRGIEVASLGLDDVLGEVEHLALDLDVGHVRERLPARTDLVVEVERDRRESAPRARMSSVRARRNSTAWAIADRRRRLEPFANQARTPPSALRSDGREIVGPVEIEVVDLAAIDEGGDRQASCRCAGTAAAISSGSSTTYSSLPTS